MPVESISILIVDEDVERKLVLHEVLHAHGHLPSAYGDAEQALAALSDGEQPDLILVADTETLSSRGFASKLAREPLWREIPMILIGDRDAERSDLFLDVLKPPLGESELMAIISRCAS